MCERIRFGCLDYCVVVFEFAYMYDTISPRLCNIIVIDAATQAIVVFVLDKVLVMYQLLKAEISVMALPRMRPWIS
jgi:hypothetical protein